jgi:hypothetical protein
LPGARRGCWIALLDVNPSQLKVDTRISLRVVFGIHQAIGLNFIRSLQAAADFGNGVEDVEGRASAATLNESEPFLHAMVKEDIV